VERQTNSKLFRLKFEFVVGAAMKRKSQSLRQLVWNKVEQAKSEFQDFMLNIAASATLANANILSGKDHCLNNV
jgi:hypothetical protein